MAPRSRIEREVLAQAVARHHLQNHLSFKKLAPALGLSERDARDLYRLARDEGLVKVVVTARFSAPPVLNDDLSQKLLAQRSVLRRAIVVEVAKPPDGADDDVLLHRQLGRAAAEHLVNEVRDSDVLAVGAGRGPMFTADAIEQLAADPTRDISVRDVRLMSICGGSIRRLPQKNTDPGTLDADIVAESLSEVFGSSTRDRQSSGEEVSQPLFVFLPLAMNMESAHFDQVILSVAPHLLPLWWQKNRVDICLVGVGVLGPKHFAMQKGAHTKEIAPLLDNLSDLILNQEDGVGLVADVAHRFWLTTSTGSELERSAEAIVERINHRIVGVHLSSLDRAREKIMVAGGESKYPALRAMVAGTGACTFHPTTLVTDSDTARKLIEELDRGPTSRR